jgi:RNA polymerase sigma-70 factor, ECF subfamily
VQKPDSAPVPQAEFAAFMRAYQNMVFSTAVRLTANEAQAEDIAQEVFLKAFERFDSLADNPAAGGWLKTVATNLSLNHLSRYRRRWRFFSEMVTDSEAGPEQDFQVPEVLSDEVFDALATEDRRERIENALTRLADHQRVPLVLFHFEGMSYEDIAARLGVSIAKLKTDSHRGRLRLARSLIGNDTACPEDI